MVVILNILDRPLPCTRQLGEAGFIVHERKIVLPRDTPDDQNSSGKRSS